MTISTQSATSQEQAGRFNYVIEGSEGNFYSFAIFDTQCPNFTTAARCFNADYQKAEDMARSIAQALNEANQNPATPTPAETQSTRFLRASNDVKKNADDAEYIKSILELIYQMYYLLVRTHRAHDQWRNPRPEFTQNLKKAITKTILKAEKLNTSMRVAGKWPTVTISLDWKGLEEYALSKINDLYLHLERENYQHQDKSITIPIVGLAEKQPHLEKLEKILGQFNVKGQIVRIEYDPFATEEIPNDEPAKDSSSNTPSIAPEINQELPAGYFSPDKVAETFILGAGKTNPSGLLSSESRSLISEQPTHQESINAADFLHAGIGHMQDRAATYDTPEGERSMARVVAMFNVYKGLNLTEVDGWRFMEILKMVRSDQGQFKADNYEDGCAYAGLAGEAAARASVISE